MLKPTWLNNRLITIIVWVLAIIIRLYGAWHPAQYYDIGTFEAWSRAFWEHGPRSFFHSVWSDYLPLPILTFAPISAVADFLHVPFGLIFKLIHLTLELILIATLPKKYLVPKLLLLLSPALIGDTAFWGQVDTIPALLALLSLSQLLTPGVKGSHTPGVSVSALLYGLSVAYKPIMILIAPILWIMSLKRGQRWWQFPLISMVVFFATAIPTGGISFISHIFSRIFAQSATYPFLTVNAFNLWSLVPNLSWIADSTNVFHLSGRSLGILLFSLFSLSSLNSWRKLKFLPQHAPRVAATILITFFAFTTRMHERHLLFGLPFLALATATDFWLLIPLLVLSFTFTLNLYGAYIWVNHAQTWPFSLSVISLLSWITVFTSLALSTIWSWPQALKSATTFLKSNQLLVSILVVATLLRFINLGHPPTYIFDEVYHAFTSREYLHNHVEAWEWWTTPPEGVAYEWTHPPLAKYGMVLGMLLFGENSFGWRIGSASFGVISILGLYLLILALTKNKSIALISAFLVSLEGLHLSQSRVAMNDIYMLAFYLWALYLAVKSRWKSSAICYGLALASKWSALYGVIPLAIIYFHNYSLKIFNLKSLILKLINIIRLLLIALAVYVLTFAPFILAGHTWGQWWELHRQMWYYHTHLVATHAYQSTPLEWLFAARPVWYWVNYSSSAISNIYAQSNPLILWLGLVALILQFKKIFLYPYTILYTLYLIFTLPWMFSPRIMFFYHYLPSSVFLCVILASWLSSLSKKYLYCCMLLAVCSLLIISPMLYGFPTPLTYWNTLFTLFPSWK